MDSSNSRVQPHFKKHDVSIRQGSRLPVQVVLDLGPRFSLGILIVNCGRKLSHRVTGLDFRTIFTMVIKQLTVVVKEITWL